MKKYHVKGSYLQFFECFVMAESQEDAEEQALSGDTDYMMQDCNDWYIDSVEEAKQ